MKQAALIGLATFFASALSAGAFSNPTLYYDWNRYGLNQRRVLAAETEASASAVNNYWKQLHKTYFNLNIKPTYDCK